MTKHLSQQLDTLKIDTPPKVDHDLGNKYYCDICNELIMKADISTHKNNEKHKYFQHKVKKLTQFLQQFKKDDTENVDDNAAYNQHDLNNGVDLTKLKEEKEILPLKSSGKNQSNNNNSIKCSICMINIPKENISEHVRGENHNNNLYKVTSQDRTNENDDDLPQPSSIHDTKRIDDLYIPEYVKDRKSSLESNRVPSLKSEFHSLFSNIKKRDNSITFSPRNFFSPSHKKNDSNVNALNLDWSGNNEDSVYNDILTQRNITCAFCDICNVKIPNTNKNISEHFNGKKHKMLEVKKNGKLLYGKGGDQKIKNANKNFVSQENKEQNVDVINDYLMLQNRSLVKDIAYESPILSGDETISDNDYVSDSYDSHAGDNVSIASNQSKCSFEKNNEKLEQLPSIDLPIPSKLKKEEIFTTTHFEKCDDISKTIEPNVNKEITTCPNRKIYSHRRKTSRRDTNEKKKKIVVTKVNKKKSLLTSKKEITDKKKNKPMVKKEKKHTYQKINPKLNKAKHMKMLMKYDTTIENAINYDVKNTYKTESNEIYNANKSKITSKCEDPGKKVRDAQLREEFLKIVNDVAEIEADLSELYIPTPSPEEDVNNDEAIKYVDKEIETIKTESIANVLKEDKLKAVCDLPERWFYCTVCSVNISHNDKHLREHFLGKKHKIMADRRRKEIQAETATTDVIDEDDDCHIMPDEENGESTDTVGFSRFTCFKVFIIIFAIVFKAAEVANVLSSYFFWLISSLKTWKLACH